MSQQNLLAFGLFWRNWSVPWFGSFIFGSFGFGFCVCVVESCQEDIQVVIRDFSIGNVSARTRVSTCVGNMPYVLFVTFRETCEKRKRLDAHQKIEIFWLGLRGTVYDSTGFRFEGPTGDPGPRHLPTVSGRNRIEVSFCPAFDVGNDFLRN